MPGALFIRAGTSDVCSPRRIDIYIKRRKSQTEPSTVIPHSAPGKKRGPFKYNAGEGFEYYSLMLGSPPIIIKCTV